MWFKIYEPVNRLFHKTKENANRLFHKVSDVAHKNLTRENLTNFSTAARKVGNVLSSVSEFGGKLLEHPHLKERYGHTKEYDLLHKGSQFIGLGGILTKGIHHLTDEHSYRQGKNFENDVHNAHNALERVKNLHDTAQMFNYI